MKRQVEHLFQTVHAFRTEQSMSWTF